MDTRTCWAAGVIIAALVIAIIVAAVAGSANAGSPPLVERDAAGHRTGTIEVQPGGRATFRNAQGA